MKVKSLFTNLMFLVFGFAASYFFYMKTKIDNISDQLIMCRSEKELCLQDNKILKKNDQNLQLQIKKAEIESEYMQKDIQLLEKGMLEKEEKILELNNEIELKKKEIDKGRLDLKKVIEQGATDEMREEISSLYKKIDELTSQNRQLEFEKESIRNEMALMQEELLSKQKELDIINKVTIPDINQKFILLEQELDISKQFREFYNLRAEIQNIRIDNKRDIMQFDLLFDTDEIEYLRQNLEMTQYTFKPKITNETKNTLFIPQIKDFSEFTKDKTELTEFITVTFPVSNYELKRYKNGTKGVNLKKGDKIKIDIVLEELFEMEIANKSFYLK